MFEILINDNLIHMYEIEEISQYLYDQIGTIQTIHPALRTKDWAVQEEVHNIWHQAAERDWINHILLIIGI